MGEQAGGQGRRQPGEGSGQAEKESCVPYFDELWFCYSPVHQFQEYYRYGQVDDCTGAWARFYRCLKKRTKFADQVPKAEERAGNPLWTMRTPEEGAEAWQREFGHLDEPLGSGSSTEGANGPREQEPGSKPTFV